MKTRVIIHVDGEVEVIDTELDFNTAVRVVMSKHPIAGFDCLYQPTVIRSIGLIEPEIEIEAILI